MGARPHAPLSPTWALPARRGLGTLASQCGGGLPVGSAGPGGAPRQAGTWATTGAVGGPWGAPLTGTARAGAAAKEERGGVGVREWEGPRRG